KHVRGGDLGGRVPGAGLGVRRVLRRGGRGGGPAGAGPARPAGGGRRRLGGGAVWLALVRRPRRRPARAGPALVAGAPAAGALRAGADGSQPAGIDLADPARRVPAGDRLGLVRAAGTAAGARRPAGRGLERV